MPDGPAAAPRRAHFRFFKTRAFSRVNGFSATTRANLPSTVGMALLAVARGLTEDPESSAFLAQELSNAWRPEETSPINTKLWARSARRSVVSV